MNNSGGAMKMQKKWKGCLMLSLGIFFVIIVIVAIFVITILNSWGEQRRQAEKDRVEHSAACDTIEYITEQPMLKFSHFDEEEVKELRFRILRNGTLLNDTVVKGERYFDTDRFSVDIPYDRFLKTDTIVVMTKTPLYFYVSGYHHYAYLHYGMFGYLGHSDCRLSETCTVNGREYEGYIVKCAGWTELPPAKSGNKRIYRDMPEFEALNENTPVVFDDACELFKKQTGRASPTFLYYEDGFYGFINDMSFERDYTIETNYEVIKINSTTGEVVKAPNFPFD